MEPTKNNRCRRFELDDSEDEVQAPISARVSRRRQFVLDSSEDEEQARIASRSPKARETRNTRVIDLDGDSEDSEDAPIPGMQNSSPGKGTSTHQSILKPPTGNQSLPAASSRRRKGGKREFADLTGDDDDSPIVYKPITEDEARALVGMEPTQKSEVDLLQDYEDERDKEDREDEADDEAPSRKRRRSRR